MALRDLLRQFQRVLRADERLQGNHSQRDREDVRTARI